MPMVRIVGQGETGDDRDEDADADHELVEGSERAARLLGRNLGDVHGHQVGTRADAQAGEQAPDQDDGHDGRARAQEGAHQERHGDGHEGGLSPVLVRKFTRHERSDSGADEEDAHHETLELRVRGDAQIPSDVLEPGLTMPR